MHEVVGPTSHAKHDITNNSVASTWSLLVSESMVWRIKLCTEAEAHRQLKHDDWVISFDELLAFIAILYARGAYGARNLKLQDLWCQMWGVHFFLKQWQGTGFRK